MKKEKVNPQIRKMKLYHFDWGKLLKYTHGDKPIVSVPSVVWEKKQPNQLNLTAKVFGIEGVKWDPIVGSRYIDTKVEITREHVYSKSSDNPEEKIFSHIVTKVKLKPSIGEMTVVFEIDKKRQKTSETWKIAYEKASGTLTRTTIAIESNRDLIIASTIIETNTNNITI